WEAASGQRLRSFPERATALAFSRDGKYLAAGIQEGKVKIWTVADGIEYATLGAVPTVVRSVAFDPDTHRLAVGDSCGNICVWDFLNKRPLSMLHGSAYQVYALAFSPDGATLVSGGRETTKLWDAGTGRLLLELNTGDFVRGLAFSPDGNKLIVSDESEFGTTGSYLWDLENGRGIQTLRGLSAQVSRICFSADGRLVAALSHDWQ